MHKRIADLGTAAYLMMKGFKVVGREARDIYFLIEPSQEPKFDRVSLDYLSSEFHRFDSCIMALKKINENIVVDLGKSKFVTDLGAAAFIMMHQYKILGKRGKTLYFEVDEASVDKFDELSLDYLSSDFHKFDSCLMSLKKIGEYVSENNKNKS